MELPDWTQLVNEFKAKANRFIEGMNYLANNPGKFNYSTAAANERARLLANGQTIKSTIENVKSAIDKANALLKSVGQFVGLSALPIVVPVAIVTAAIASVTYWLTSYDRLLSDMYEDQKSQGVPASTAVKNISTVPGGSSPISAGNMVTKAVPYVTVIGLLWLAFN